MQSEDKGSYKAITYNKMVDLPVVSFLRVLVSAGTVLPQLCWQYKQANLCMHTLT